MLVNKPTPKALVVDDLPDVAGVVCRSLNLLDFKVRAVYDPLEALEVCRTENFDLVVLDINMPQMNGIELLRRLKSMNPAATYVMLTGEDEDNFKTITQALREGAQGFVLKPFHVSQLLDSVQLALERTRLLRNSIRMKVYSPLLEGATAALLSALEAKDTSTQNHSSRVSYYAQQMTQAFRDYLSYEEMVQVRLGALFHDVGKIGVPDIILKKPGPLTPEERKIIMKHPEIGEKIIGAVEGMEKVAAIVRAHHEWYNGNGYPDGLKGYDIPLGARIATVADCFEAIVSPRVYSPGRSVDFALAELKRCRGTQFDPDVVDIFLDMISTGEIVYQPAHPEEAGYLLSIQSCRNPVVPKSA